MKYLKYLTYMTTHLIIFVIIMLSILIAFPIHLHFRNKKLNEKLNENVNKYDVEISYCDNRKNDTITTYSQYEITNDYISTYKVAVPQINLLVDTNKYRRFLNVCNIKTIKKYEN